MTPSPALFRLLLTAACLCASARASESPVSRHWQAFVAAKDRAPAGILADYSYAGYRHGEAAIPSVAGPVFEVTTFGAIPDDDRSDEAAIRLAIAAAEEAGGGVVLFPPGRFLVWTERASQRSILISRSGVVLRGAGSAAGGTVIQAVHSGYGTGPYPVPKKGADFAAIPYVFAFQAQPAAAPAAAALVDGAVPRASFVLPVDSAASFHPGDWITVGVRTNALNPILLDGLATDPSWTRLGDGAALNESHQIRAVGEKSLTLHEPLLVGLGADFGARVVKATRIQEVGVEDIAFVGGWLADFVHHRNALDDEGWDALLFDGVAHGWVRRCSFTNFTSGVYLIRSSACSIIQNRYAGNRGHYNAAARTDSSFNLLGLSEDGADHLHAVSTGNRSAGTVLWRWRLSPSQSVDSHGNGPYTTLVDRVDGGTFTKSGGPGPSFPNHFTGLTFWNFLFQGPDPMPINLWEMRKNGVAKFVRPLFVGLHGLPVEFTPGTLLDNESAGVPVAPESLYEAQLRLRLGSSPAWIAAARAEWAVLRTLPPAAEPPPHEESFPLSDLLADLRALLGNQELGWALPVDFVPPSALPVVRRDYVRLRTLLHQLCTYASPRPVKDDDGAWRQNDSTLAVRVQLEPNAVVFTFPISASSKDRIKNAAALATAQSLAQSCRATVQVAPDSLRLSLAR